MVEPLITDVARETLGDARLDDEADDIFNSTIETMVREVASESLEELEEVVRDTRKRTELRDVATMAEKIVFSLMYRHLLTTVASDAEAILVRTELESLVGQLLGRAMIANLRGVAAVKTEVCENIPLRALHQEIVGRSGLSYLLALLPKVLTECENDTDTIDDKGNAQIGDL